MPDGYSRSAFDWRRFGRDCRDGFRGIPQRQLARRIGVTLSDVSRAASGGNNVGVHTVMAICDFLGLNERDYYLAPERDEKETSTKSARFTTSNVKHQEGAH